MTKRILAAAVAVALVGASAAARAGSSTYDVISPQLHRSTALAGYLRHAGTPDAVEAAMRRWQVDSAATVGVPAAMILAAQAAAAPPGAVPRVVSSESDSVVVVSGSGSIAMSFLQPAADLDGDGTRDVLDVRYGGGESGPARVATAARSGSTGRVLWHRTDVMGSGHFLFPMAYAVGAPARPGVVLVDSGMSKTGDSTMEVTDRFTALAGRTGGRLWQHADKGTVDFSNGFSGRHVPGWAGILQLAAGAKDVLLTFTDFQDSSDGTGESGSVAAYRLTGAGGVASRSGAAVSSGDSIPAVAAISDVSRDGRDDYVVLVGGTSSSVEARRGVDGTAVWTSTALTLNPGAYAESVGHLAGTGFDDIAVTTGTPRSPLPVFGTPVGDVSDPSTPAHGEVGLLRGDTGAVVWHQTGDGAVRLLRAGPDRVPALGVTTADASTDADGTTETLHLMAYDVAGTQLYDQTYTVQVPADAQDSFGFGVAGAYATSDFAPDGARDGFAALLAFNGSNYRRRTFLFDGATGTALAGDHAALYGSLTGSGDDLVDVTASGSVLVTALRGRDQKRLFATRLKPATSMQSGDAYAERIRGRCGDVLVTASGKSGAYAAVLTATGRVRWSIDHGTQDLRPTAPRLGPATTSAVCA